MNISRRTNRLMAYVYMPLVFTVFGYLCIYIAFKPIISIGVSLTSMVMAQEAPNFSIELQSIYVEPELPQTPPEEKEDENVVKLEDVQWPYSGQHYAQMYCERIGLEAPLYMGDSNKILKVGAGQYIGSFIPGYGRPIMVAAHCTTFFRPFQYVKEGDIFVIKTSYGIYEYKVTHTRIVKPDDKSAYDLGQRKEQLIMYTCYPFRLLSGSRQQRMFVYADKISGPELK